jgi:DNA gyrase subunit A
VEQHYDDEELTALKEAIRAAVMARGGKGIVAMTLTKKTGKIVGSFPVEEADQVTLVTDGGKLIRTPVAGIRIAGRSTQGVIVLNTAEDEKVVSLERLSEEDGDSGESE